MGKKYTASEVRDCIAYFYGDKLTRISAMLTAFADLLEAQEKAVPVATRRFVIRELLRVDASPTQGSGVYVYYNMENNDRVRRSAFYACDKNDGETLVDLLRSNNHTDAPSDAERLAKALRMCMDIMLEHGVPIHPDADARVAYTAAEQALTAHSAQAQPPAQPKYAPPYPDQTQDPFWKVPGMVDTRPKAQPPAASVTIDAVMRVIDGQRRLPYCSIDEKQAFRNELEAALAAQENK